MVRMTHLSSDVKKKKRNLKNRSIGSKKKKHTSLNLTDFEASKNLKLGSINVRNAPEKQNIILTAN